MTLSQRLSIQIAIALAADVGCNDALNELMATASVLGLTGIEIDAARNGRSFDVRHAAAVALGCAYRDGSRVRIALSRKKALRAGLTTSDADAVKRLALEYLARRTAAAGSARKRLASRRAKPTSAR